MLAPPVEKSKSGRGFFAAAKTQTAALEREADRIASQVTRGSGLEGAVAGEHSQVSHMQPRLRAGAAGGPLEWGRTAPSPDSFRGRGSSLPAPVRGFFEQRLGYDFSGVRVHRGSDASESARSVNARAYTYGRDIVLGAGEPFSGSKHATELLAHELTHVVQQGDGPPLVQRSPLSDSVKAAWTAQPTTDALLTRLSQSDVQKAQADADVDAEIARLLSGRPDDLWVAQQIRKGQLARKSSPTRAGGSVPRPIKAVFVRGSTERRALVIGGVHGTEQQGIEVVNTLISDLQLQPKPPVFATILVPSLFPDNAARNLREDPDNPTNRNFPLPSEDLAAATAAGGGKPVDASLQHGRRTRAILPENQLLLALLERFHPERIISVHGTQAPGQAGVFYDRRSPSEEEDRTARELAKGIPGGQELPLAVQERLYRAHLAARAAGANQTDRDLSLAAASKIDAATTSIKGREGREFSREKESPATTAANEPARRAHPSIGGNVGPKGALDNATWLGSVPGGVSLGGYAPPRGISVFTVEPPVDAPSTAYPNAKDIVTGRTDKLTQADRITELKAYADAVRTILLGSA